MKNIFKFFVLASLLSSCVGTRSTYVHEGYEPVLLQKKNDLTLSASLHGLSLLKLNAGYALDSNYSVRAGYSGYFGIDNYDVSAIRTFQQSKQYLFIAASYNYQSNVRKAFTGLRGFQHNKYQFDCRYHTASIVAGINFKSEHVDNQFFCKIGWNHVVRYALDYQSSHPGLYRDQYLFSDVEKLNRQIPDFATVELSYCFLWPMNKVVTFKFQASALYTQKTFRHDYQFNALAGNRDEKDLQSASKLHPFTSPGYLSLGLIFKL